MLTLEKMTKMNSFLMGIWKIAYLNLLWFAFSLLGMVFLGVGPATYAMMKYYDRWFRLQEEPPVFKTFWNYYKERFKQSALLGVIMILVATVLIVNIFNVTHWFVQVVNVLMFFIFIIGSTHIFNVMAALKYQTIREIIRASTMMGVGYLHYTIILWTVIIGGYYLLSVTLPGLLILFGIGFIGAAISFVGKRIVVDFEDEE